MKAVSFFAQGQKNAHPRGAIYGRPGVAIRSIGLQQVAVRNPHATPYLDYT